ncbi:insulin degRading enzyme, putative, partial [Perkinsus marinus ATCC 50983]
MLFMGSKKYPGENEFETYLSKNGGYSNAYTELEYTCYYFECTVSGFEKAVDMFSGFFTNPLMNPDSSERELEAVESEYRQTLNSDSARLEQLGCYMAEKDHIWKKFTWGNKKSLLQGSDDYSKLREALLQFYDRYYVSGRMRACMVGRMSLDDMEKQL